MGELEQLSIDQLIARYSSAASRHGKATLRGDASTGNADADTIASVYRELRRRSAEPALLALLDSPDLGVLSWSAAHALDFAPVEGERMLRALAESGESGPIVFGADMTLREWRMGRLHFP